MTKGQTYRVGFVFGLAVLLGLLSFENTHAQRINFSTWTGSDDITITPVGGLNLNFNQKQANISANSPAVAINLADMQTVAFRIEAPEGFDLTVEVDAPTVLSLNGTGTDPEEEQIPFRVGIAYNNLLAGEEMTAKNGAISLPLGFFNVTFPVNRRTAGVPGPPPTPESGGTVRPKATAWLFIFGELGPIGLVNAGLYSGDITINVFFTSND